LSNSTISIVLPSKNRQKQLTEMIISCLETANLPDLVDFVVFVDRGDTQYEFPIYLQQKIKIISGESMWLSTLYNFAASQAQGDIIMYGSDDIVFKTLNWDMEVKKAFNSLRNNFGLVFPNDKSSYQGKIATHGFVTKSWITTFGYLLPPYFPNVYTDVWVTELAKSTNCLIYLEQVIIEHNQYRQGKSELDSTYLARIPDARIKKSKLTFRSLRRELRIDVLKSSNTFDVSVNFKFKYLIATVLYWFFKKSTSYEEKIILLSTPNHRIALLVLRKIKNTLHKNLFVSIANFFNR